MKAIIQILTIGSMLFLLGATGPECASAECDTDADCSGGQVCELEGPGCGPQMACVAGCHQDEDCPGGQVCHQLMCFTCPCPGQCAPETTEAQEGEACGDDIATACADGLYCAHGWCGTPPVIGTCRTMGACDWEGNCLDEANQWSHDDCQGAPVCEESSCLWVCQ